MRFISILLITLTFLYSYGKSSPQSEFDIKYDIVHAGQKAFEAFQFTNALQNSTDYMEIIDQIRNIKFDPLLLKDLFNNLSAKCVGDLLYFAKKLNTTDYKEILNSWAFKMLDAYGKPESGFLLGSFKWVGDFKECRSVYAPRDNLTGAGDFHGKYCSLQIPMNSQLIVLSMGLCLPESCLASDLNNGIKNLINVAKVIPFMDTTVLNSTTVTCKVNSRKLTNGAIVTIFFLSFFTFLVVLGSSITAYKYVPTISKNRRRFLKQNSIRINFDKEKGEDSDEIIFHEQLSKTKLSVFLEKADSFLNCFCIFTNGAKLLDTDAGEGQMMCLHGIRFLSMSWVILCHMYSFSFNSVKAVEPLLDAVDNWPFQVILNGSYSVDSFFVLSAFLMSFLYLEKATKKKGSISWLYFYLHRYLRLTPVYMLMLVFYTFLYPYFGSGPFWPDYDIDPICQKNWWWNLLYINNFSKATDLCFSWSWYLSNDMQFFIISPLYLITLLRWPKIGFALLIVTLFGAWTTCFIIAYSYNMSYLFGDIRHTISQPNFMTRWTDVFEKLYTKPYSRIAPYLVGIVLGFILYKRKVTPTKDNKIVLLIGWVVAASAGTACIYGFYHNTPGLVAFSFYSALSRTAFGLSLSWVIYVCLTQQAVLVDKILSLKLFIPLSRSTYSAYLIHPMIVTGYFASLKNPVDFSHETMVMLFLGFLTVSYAFALIVSLLFESPIIRLEKLIRT